MSMAVGTTNLGFSGDISRYYGPALSRAHSENLAAFLMGQPIEKGHQSLGQEITGEMQGGLLWGVQMASPYVGLNMVKNFKNVAEAAKVAETLNGGKVTNATINAFSAFTRSEKFLNKYNCAADSNRGLKWLYPQIDAEALKKINYYRNEIKAGRDLIGNSAALEQYLKSVAPQTWIEKIVKTKTINIAEAEKAALKAANDANTAAAAKAAATTTSKVGLLAKGQELVKSGGFKGMFVIDAAMSLFMDIIPTFLQLGAEKGVVQTVKSTVQATASAGGFSLGMAAGAVAGAKAGALAGTAIGSIVPGLGNAVGAVVGGAVGIACGLLGSWIGRKAAKAIIGKSELEKDAEAKKQAQAQKLATNPELQIKAAQEALVKAMKDPNSQDSRLAIKAANAVLENYSAGEQISNPSFGSLTNPAIQAAGATQPTQAQITQAPTTQAPTTQNAALWADYFNSLGQRATV